MQEFSSEDFKSYLEQLLERPTKIKLRPGGTKHHVADSKLRPGRAVAV